MPKTKTKEHPIIFNDWSIKRILAGEKTQTRRVVKPQPDHVLHDRKNPVVESPIEVVEDGELIEKTHADSGNVFVDEISSPYGRDGDVLWVREAFQLPLDKKEMSPKEYVQTYRQYAWKYAYPADGTKEEGQRAGVHFGRRRPSIHMPRELCRLRLRVEDVRVERVQEITANDAFAEGIKPWGGPPHQPSTAKQAKEMQADALISSFRNKWNDIHGDGAWERNEWVWVISFSRIEAENQ